MRHPHATRALGRTVVVGAWLLALAVAGDPIWLVAPLGVFLVLVWASPYALATNRRGRPIRDPDESAVTLRPAGATGSIGQREGE